MLREYFSIGFEVTGDPSSPPAKVMLTHLPHLVDGHVPPLALLPDLLVTLAYDVAWTEEKPCFRSLAQTLAAFYADPGPPTLESGKEEAPEEHATSFSAGARPAQATMDPINDTALRHGVGNLLLPALQRHAGFKPPSKLARGHYVVQVASTEQLYKIFERC
jgi:DNA mismatch repair protein MLH1